MIKYNILVAIVIYMLTFCSCTNDTKDIYRIDSSKINVTVLAIVDNYVKSYPQYKKLSIVSDFKFAYSDKDVVEREMNAKLYSIGRLSKYNCYVDSLVCTGDIDPSSTPFPTLYFTYRDVQVFCFSSNDRLINLKGSKSFFDKNAENVKPSSSEDPLWVFAVDDQGKARLITKDIKSFGIRKMPQEKYTAPVK